MREPRKNAEHTEFRRQCDVTIKLWNAFIIFFSLFHSFGGEGVGCMSHDSTNTQTTRQPSAAVATVTAPSIVEKVMGYRRVLNNNNDVDYSCLAHREIWCLSGRLLTECDNNCEWNGMPFPTTHWKLGFVHDEIWNNGAHNANGGEANGDEAKRGGGNASEALGWQKMENIAMASLSLNVYCTCLACINENLETCDSWWWRGRGGKIWRSEICTSFTQISHLPRMRRWNDEIISKYETRLKSLRTKRIITRFHCCSFVKRTRRTVFVFAYVSCHNRHPPDLLLVFLLCGKASKRSLPKSNYVPYRLIGAPNAVVQFNGGCRANPFNRDVMEFTLDDTQIHDDVTPNIEHRLDRKWHPAAAAAATNAECRSLAKLGTKTKTYFTLNV